MALCETASTCEPVLLVDAALGEHVEHHGAHRRKRQARDLDLVELLSERRAA